MKSSLTPELIEDLLHAVENGGFVRRELKKRGICVQSWYNSLDADKLLMERYTRARERQAEALEEDILDASDSPDEDPNRSRLKVDARKWIMARTHPRRYGDKVTQEITGEAGGPLVVKWEK